jgi:hypothetical protein
MLSALVAVIAASTSCMTTYDSAGRPVQSVDPGMAVAGAAAAGLIGYAIANDNDDNHHHNHYNHYYRRPPHRYYR